MGYQTRLHQSKKWCKIVSGLTLKGSISWLCLHMLCGSSRNAYWERLTSIFRNQRKEEEARNKRTCRSSFFFFLMPMQMGNDVTRRGVTE